MGFLSELKKVFFGASSVAKHASEKTGDYIKKESKEWADEAKEKFDHASDVVSEKTSGLKQSIKENTEELLEKAKKKMDELGEEPIVKKAADISENVGDKVLDAGEKLVEKAKNISEKVGEKVLDEGDELLEKGKDLSENVGTKVLEVKDELVEKAKDAAEKIGEKLNETMDKAEAWAEAEKSKPKKDFADEDLSADGSLLEGSDDFFSKASKYADGDYDAFSEGKITIEKPDNTKVVKPIEKATNFTDLDGDGNEIIDDAIVDNSDDSGEESGNKEEE